MEEGRNMFLGDSRNEQILVMRVDLLYVPEWKNTNLFVVLDVCIRQRSLFEEIYLKILH